MSIAFKICPPSSPVIPGIRDLDTISSLSDSNAIIITRACVKRIAATSGAVAHVIHTTGRQDPPKGYPTAACHFFSREKPGRHEKLRHALFTRIQSAGAVHISLSSDPPPLPPYSLAIVVDFGPAC